MSGIGLSDQIGGYRLDGLAGQGGMGVVYRAVELERERTVALKLIAPPLASDPVFRERFQREARLLAAVEHPHVIPFFDADEAEGRLFLSMRWIDGPSLAGVIGAGGGLDPARALLICAQIAGALDAVHAHGLVHRDLKPANVLLEQRAHGEHAYLSDFGAGRALDVPSDATGTGQWIGSFDYLAPEVLAGDPADPRSDRYALGCVLFEALTGAPPFHRDTMLGTLWAHQRDPAPSVRERRPALPRQVDGVLARALAKDPAARYRSAAQLAEAFADALQAARGPHTQPSGPGRRVPRRRGRVSPGHAGRAAVAPSRLGHRRLVAAVATGMLALRARWRRPQVWRTAVMAAPVLIAVVAYLLIGWVPAAPRGRAPQAHRPTSPATVAQRPATSTASDRAKPPKPHRRSGHRPSTQRRAGRSSRGTHRSHGSSTGTSVRYTQPATTSTNSSPATLTTPASSANTTPSSGSSAGTSSGPSGSAPFGPGYPGG